MSDLRALDRRRSNYLVIRGLTHSLRSLSAVEYRRATEGLTELRGYASTLRRALRRVRGRPGETTIVESSLLVVIGSDQGLCGPLTERVTASARDRARELGSGFAGAIAVGRRTADALAAESVRVLVSREAPSSVAAIGPAVAWIARQVEHHVARRSCDGVELVYPRHEGPGRYEVRALRVLPVDHEALAGSGLDGRGGDGEDGAGERDDGDGGEAERRRAPPRLQEPSSAVVSSIIEEWTFTEVFRAVSESIASEHGARLRVTDSATHAIDEKLEELRLERNRVRQDGITAELLEANVAWDAVVESS